MGSRSKTVTSVPAHSESVYDWMMRNGIRDAAAREMDGQVKRFLTKAAHYKECLAVGVSANIGEKDDVHLWIHLLTQPLSDAVEKRLKQLRTELTSLDLLTLENSVVLHVEYFLEKNIQPGLFRQTLIRSNDFDVLGPQYPARRSHGMDGLDP